MNWIDLCLWALIALTAVGAIVTILDVGKPRAPRTPLDAAVAVVLDACIIAILTIKVLS
jgi:hypothetical protein